MLKLKILSVGKTKEKWLDEAFSEYVKRLKPFVQIECVWAKDTSQLMEWAQKEILTFAWILHGHLFTSEELSHFLFSIGKKRALA